MPTNFCRNLPWAVMISSLGVAAGAAGQLQPGFEHTQWGPDVFGGYPSTHVIVKVQPGVEPTHDPALGWSFRPAPDNPRARQPAGRAPAAQGGDPQPQLRETLTNSGVTAITGLFAQPPANQELARQIGLDRYYLVHVPAGTDTPALAAALSGFESLIAEAELDGIGGAAQVPDDPHLGLQYAMLNTGQNVNGQNGIAGADINATLAWDITTGSGSTVIAVVDSGTNDHVELSGRLLTGWNTVLDNTDTSDGCFSHGTHVAGISAAAGNNALGVAGVNWQAQVLPVRVLTGCNGSETDLAEGIIWAVDNGADIINMSLQYYTGTTALHNAVIYAYEEGVALCCASGNNSSVVAFPGRWPETIAVAATDNRDEKASFSNPGPELDVAAPGDDIYSLTNTGTYGFKFGTSMAAPHVTGVASLLLAVNPALTPEQVRTALRSTAVDVETAGFDELTGWGRIDASAALQSLNLVGDVTGDGSVDVDDLTAVILGWGECGEGSACPADINDDGFVDIDDFVLVILNWTN